MSPLSKGFRLKLSFRKKVNLGFFVSILIILTFTFYAIHVSNNLDHVKKLNLKTYDVIKKLYDLISETKDLEIHRKDYLLTKKDLYLEAYYHVLVNIQKEINLLYLQDYFKDKETQRIRFINIIQIISKSLDCLLECKYEPQKKNPIHEIVKNHFQVTEVKIFAEDMRNLLEEIAMEERYNLYEKQDQEERYSHFINFFIASVGAFVVLGLFVLIYFVNRDILLDRLQIAELKNLSVTDELTGLNNRRGFIQQAKHRLHETILNKKKLFLYFIDMDDLKVINDTLGHEYGDRAIKTLSEILKQSFRLTDVIARLGGDEFAVIMTDEHVHPSVIYQRLQKKISEYNSTNKEPFKLSISIGHTEFDPSSPMSIEEVIQEADKKMYKQKKERKAQQKKQ